MKIFAIDTSCDETSVAILNGRRVIGNVISSQIDLHKKWGGVVPDIARNAHKETLPKAVKQAFKRAGVTEKDIDCVAVTYGPGLAIALEVGLQYAKSFAISYGKKFVAVNHIEGHLLSGLLLNRKGSGIIKESENLHSLFPALGMVISGSHTDLVKLGCIDKYELLGETLDDAVGEAFDKVARMLNLGYPGGPIITSFAEKFRKKNKRKYFDVRSFKRFATFKLPVTMERSGDLNFSYSGLKTACLYKIKKLRESAVTDKEWVYEFCSEFIDAVSYSLLVKIESAIKANPDIKTFFLGGGVISNKYILGDILRLVRSHGLKAIYPEKTFRTDNAAMIGLAVGLNIENKSACVLENKEEISDIERVPVLSF